MKEAGYHYSSSVKLQSLSEPYFELNSDPEDETMSTQMRVKCVPRDDRTNHVGIEHKLSLKEHFYHTSPPIVSIMSISFG